MDFLLDLNKKMKDINLRYPLSNMYPGGSIRIKDFLRIKRSYYQFLDLLNRKLENKIHFSFPYDQEFYTHIEERTNYYLPYDYKCYDDVEEHYQRLVFEKLNITKEV